MAAPELRATPHPAYTPLEWKQRHGQVTGVRLGEAVALHQRRGREQHDGVRHLDGLGLAAGPRSEDHHEGVIGPHLTVRDEFLR